ncbi:MAG: cytochrome c-type biogenesis protein CcmH [Hyphomicrobiales bacterium]|nr:cytochrome c-type biogenesis protein CcmH [Hyphomicrobiales bacterium]
MLKRLLLALLIVWISAMPLRAVQPDEVLADPALEARARGLSVHFRCLVCQNQSIDDSDAPLARDLRLLIRERLTAGDSDNEVIDYLVSRYGEFVLLKPRFATHTLVLWLGPFVILLAGLAFVIRHRRRDRTAPNEQPLTGEEAQELERILKP